MIEQLSRLGCLLLTLGVIGCQQHKDPVYHDQFFAFGTLIDVSLYNVERPLAESVCSQIERDLMRVHRKNK